MSGQTSDYPRGGEAKPHKKFSIFNVVAVLFVLFVFAAIFWPSTGMRKTVVYRAQCLSNVKQLGMAAIMYASDNNDQVPYGRGLVSQSEGSDLPVYEKLFAPYIKAEGILQCNEDFKEKKSAVHGKSWFEAYGSSYTFKPILPQLKPFGGADGAEKTVFVHEAANFHKVPSGVPSRNAAFYDGHAKFVSDDKIFTPR